MSEILDAIAVIGKRGTIRTSELAQAIRFQGSDDELDSALAPAVLDGRLLACAVTRGDVKTVEYRRSVSGGGKPLVYAPNAPRATPASLHAAARAQASKPATPPAPRQPVTAPRVPAKATSGSDAEADSPPVKAERLESATRARFNPANAVTNQGDQVKPFRDRVAAAFRKHGPMSTRELGAHIDEPNLSTLVGQLAKRGVFGVLGGGPRSSIYGLPDQKLAERKERPAEDAPAADSPPRSIHRQRKAKSAAQTRRKRAVKAAKKAWKTRRAAVKSGAANGARRFRPALAADGAILLLGAKSGDFEISREESRTLLKLVRRLEPREAADLVGFIARLDNAEVAA